MPTPSASNAGFGQKLALLNLLGQLGEYVDEMIAVLALLPQYQAAATLRGKAAVAVEALKIVAETTPGETDDDLVELVEALLSSPEIVAIVERLASRLKKTPAK